MSKKSRQDLLVRVRYLNPIPPPPFPPKLFNIPTNIHRLGEPSYLDHLASTTPLPMLVDSEMGMPLNLNNFENVWKGQDESLNPVVDPYRQLDPVDQLLLAPMKAKAEAKGEAKAAAVAPAEVSWMRTGNLFSRKAGAKKREATASAKQEASTDASVAAQIMTIDKTFRDLADADVQEMRHPDPKKRNLRVVETYDLLPDTETWGNNYILLKFPEQPSETTIKQSGVVDPQRLSKGVLRPILDEDVSYMELYLPTEESVETVDEVYQKPISKDGMEELSTLVGDEAEDAEISAVFPHAAYDRLRMYEVHSQEKPRKEFILTIDERPTKRRKGAYYKDVPMRTNLRKTKNKEIQDEVKWTKTRVGYREEFEDETQARETNSEQVTDSAWISEQLRQIRGTNAAEGLGEAIDDE